VLRSIFTSCSKHKPLIS